jgi:hypothetical protein
VKLAGDAGASQSESGILWYWPLAGILCGLLYLDAVIWRYRPIESAAPLEPPASNDKLRGFPNGCTYPSPVTEATVSTVRTAAAHGRSTEKATEHAGSPIQTEDSWANEVLKSLSLTGLGSETEAFAARHKPVGAVDSQWQVDSRVPEATGTDKRTKG